MAILHEIEINSGLATPAGKAVNSDISSVGIEITDPAMISWKNLFRPSEKYTPRAIRSIKAKEDFYILAFVVTIKANNLEYSQLDVDLKVKFARPERARVLDHFPNQHTIDGPSKTRHATLWDSGFFNKDFPGILTSNLYEDSISIHPAMTLHLTDVPGLTGLISLEQECKSISVEKYGRGWLWQINPGLNAANGVSQLILQTIAVPKNSKISILLSRPTIRLKIEGKKEIISKLGEEEELQFTLESHQEFSDTGHMQKL